MNMVRIRHIISMRRAVKSGPLLPPVTKNKDKSLCDSSSLDKKLSPKDIIDIHLELRELNTAIFKFDEIICLFSENGTRDGSSPKLVTTSEPMAKSDEITLSNVLTIQYAFERDQFIKLEICDYSEDEVVVNGSMIFSVAELITSRSGLAKDVVNEENGTRIAAALVSFNVRAREQPFIMQICGKNLVKKGMLENMQAYFQLYKLEDGRERNLIYKSEYAPLTPKIVWKSFKLLKSLVCDTENRQIELVCYSCDDLAKDDIIGQTTISAEQLMSDCADESKTFTLRCGAKSSKKVNGSIELLKSHQSVVHSFLDYIINGLSLSLAVAVDFSVADQSEPNETFVNDVAFVIGSIGEQFKHYNLSNAYSAFGIGARIPPLNRESQHFCLNLETDPSCGSIDGLVDAFKNAHAQVQPSSTARFAHIIYHISKLADLARKRNGGGSTTLQYAVLVIISRGVIDDLRETIQATIFASRTPISIIFIATGQKCDDMERLGLSAGRLTYQNRKAERDMLQFISLSKLRADGTRNCGRDGDGLAGVLAERAVKRIPLQTTTWLIRNAYTPSDAICSGSDEPPPRQPEQRKQHQHLIKRNHSLFSEQSESGSDHLSAPNSSIHSSFDDLS